MQTQSQFDSALWRVMVAVVFVGLLLAAPRAPARELKVKVLKACESCRLEPAPGPCQSKVHHWDRAATWVPDSDIKIHAVNIPEQSEIAIYTDIEVSAAPQMYLPEGHIFRAKYAGPGILRAPSCESSFLGSNVTTSNIVFPTGYWTR